LDLDDKAGTVSFDYKDYAQAARHRQMQLSLEEFIRRLCLHFLPPRFVKIRHYGLLANRGRQQRLEQARALLGVQAPASQELAPGKLPSPAVPAALPICPHCGHPALILIGVIAPMRLGVPMPWTDTS
jgi:hypothetical protein